MRIGFERCKVALSVGKLFIMTVKICSIQSQETAGIVGVFLHSKGFHPSSLLTPFHSSKAVIEQRYSISVPKTEAKEATALLYESGWQADVNRRK